MKIHSVMELFWVCVALLSSQLILFGTLVMFFIGVVVFVAALAGIVLVGKPEGEKIPWAIGLDDDTPVTGRPIKSSSEHLTIATIHV